MTTQTLPVETAQLSTERTLPRHLVHRAALAEVFLTDFQSVDEETFHASAQLPSAHFYYNDITGRTAHDPMAVFESVRQMLLCAMHLQHDAGADTKSITATATMDITDPEPLRTRGPLDLLLLGRVELAKEYQGAVSRVIHAVRILAGDREIGTITVDTAQRPDPVYANLRMGHRTTMPPSSDTVCAHPGGAPVPAWLVGRERAENVVLDSARTAGEDLVARLRVPVAHPSMFDHPQDHVPGPVMMEAARQAVLLLAAERQDRSPGSLYLRNVTASYLRFAELDSDITVTARPVTADDGAVVAAEVSFGQDGDDVARMRVQLGGIAGATAAEGSDAI
ncbi:AfsA-related hotdog domain-containing protein [Streptomyces sp. SL13]|uniref:AfsA-related hotdog domain-containing protein n=1 Tax=Streptantibioticus silvisoli TaxID=2705255 RepID=A0AA90K2B8_9ACTN|nr:AfsA-related hotdog domain-containing protein [Streptantibioticus silvisoli]MDI5974516.1 AfsA-related hotdog domain-containing protein [Streptantibioticus silvisoli]